MLFFSEFEVQCFNGILFHTKCMKTVSLLAGCWIFLAIAVYSLAFCILIRSQISSPHFLQFCRSHVNLSKLNGSITNVLKSIIELSLSISQSRNQYFSGRNIPPYPRKIPADNSQYTMLDFIIQVNIFTIKLILTNQFYIYLINMRYEFQHMICGFIRNIKNKLFVNVRFYYVTRALFIIEIATKLSSDCIIKKKLDTYEQQKNWI